MCHILSRFDRKERITSFFLVSHWSRAEGCNCASPRGRVALPIGTATSFVELPIAIPAKIRAQHADRLPGCSDMNAVVEPMKPGKSCSKWEAHDRGSDGHGREWTHVQRFARSPLDKKM